MCAINSNIILAATWIMLMLTYLLGDVLRIFSGDFTMGEINGKKISQGMWLGIAVVMLVPVIMIFLSLVLSSRPSRLLNIVVASFFFIFNLIGLPSYKSYYDKFLIVAGLLINLVTICYAWNWQV